MPVEQRPTAVLFDLDNTLLDRHAGFRLFCRELYHTSSLIRRSHSEEDALALMAIFDGDGGRSRYDFFSDLMRQWPGVFQDLEQAMDVYLATYPRLLVLEPETRDLLEDLQDRSVPTAIVTNGGSIMQRSKINESGLYGLVQAVTVSGEVGVVKPNRGIFERALADIQAVPTAALFVGDNPDADILGAKSLGLSAAWVSLGREWPYPDRLPDHVVSHVSEVREIVLG